MVECESCGATVDGEPTTCSNCGYSPRKTLLGNGAVYAVITTFLLVVFAPLVVDVFGAPIVPTVIAVVVLCLVTGYYGLYLILVGESATVVEDVDDYAGLLVG